MMYSIQSLYKTSKSPERQMFFLIINSQPQQIFCCATKKNAK